MFVCINSVFFQNVFIGMYNFMIFFLCNLVFIGVLWYQGEMNMGCFNEYEELLVVMIIDWCEKLVDKELFFFIVQLVNFMKIYLELVESNWVVLCEV